MYLQSPNVSPMSKHLVTVVRKKKLSFNKRNPQAEIDSWRAAIWLDRKIPVSQNYLYSGYRHAVG